ncbi:MAG: heavy-metal-associated domain-containing protein [Proteobacteria bacterium]|nr:heavy-metal-associated domain-containing protein [Pseudomonadota bacterium]
MKHQNHGTWLATAVILAALLISPSFLAAQTAGKNELKPKVTVQVDGLTCPFCAYGLEKRIKEIPAVQESIISLEDGIVELIPRAGRHIDIDEVKAAVIAGGFTPRGVQVALAGQLIEWNGMTALSINATNGEGQTVETIYMLKENKELQRLKAAVKSSGQEVFITGKAAESPPLGHPEHHPYTVIIETFQLL